MDEVGKFLPALFKKQLRRTEPRLLELLVPLWPRIAGKSMAQHSQPSAFSAGLLTLSVDGATWSAQLRHMSDQIRGEINRQLGQSVVKKVKIKTVAQSSLFDAQKLSQRTAAAGPPPPQPLMQTDSIADPEIAVAVANSYAKYFGRSKS